MSIVRRAGPTGTGPSALPGWPYGSPWRTNEFGSPLMKSMLLAVALTCCALTANAEAQSVAGEWDASMSTPGGVRTFKILFQADGDKLTGTVKRPAGDVSLIGTQKADTVTFTYVITYNDHPLEITIFTIVTGDTMKGTADFGGAGQDEFSAKRAAPPRAPPPGTPQRRP